MPQFPIPPGSKIGSLVSLSPQDSKHLARILRIEKGEKISLFDGQNRYRGEVVSIQPKKVSIQILSQESSPQLKGSITLCQALLKKEKMEWVIQKAVELGAVEVIPFTSERTIPGGNQKLARWQKIADEALKQCGRVTPMRVQPVVEFRQLFNAVSKEAEKIIFSQGEEQEDRSRGPASKFFLLIGPEGGFSEKEIQIAKEEGYRIRSLGPLTLRAETAAIAALTLIQHELGNL